MLRRRPALGGGALQICIHLYCIDRCYIDEVIEHPRRGCVDCLVGGAVVVACKIPRKENSTIFDFFYAPPRSCFPGFTRG